MRLLICLDIFLVSAVDRNNFKKCSDSSFCARRRKFTGLENEPYKIAAHELNVENSILNLTLEAQGRPTLIALHTILSGGSARIVIEENNPYKQRFQPNELLVDGFAPILLNVEESEDFIAISSADGRKLESSKTGYITKFINDGVIISISNARNMLFVEELSEKPKGVNWEEKFKSHKDSRPRGPESVSMDLTFVNSRHLYGLPEHTDSFVLSNTENGEPYRLFNLDVFQFEVDERMALYGGVPFVTSHTPELTSAALWMNAAETWVDIKYTDPEASISSWFSSSDSPTAETFWLSETGKIDLFLFPGPSAQKVNDQYTILTGRPQLPPQWATAYHQCKWNYRDEEDVKNVNEKFDEHDIPCDVIWLDIEHTNGKRYFTWDPVKFPTPNKMIDGVVARGRKMVTIVDPHIKVDDNYYIYKEGQENEVFVKKPDGTEFKGWCWPGNSAYVDYINPKSREWWSSQFMFDKYESSSSSLYIWNDMNEPSVFNGPEVSMHRDMIHNDSTSVWEHRAVHQMYGLMTQRATYEGQILRDPNARPFVLSRSFFVGTQRWGPIWTGDNGAEWSHLKSSIPMLLSLGITGMPFVGADVGGFFGNPNAELVWRWYQMGSMQPFFRAHAHLDSKRREPWIFGDPWTSRIRNAVKIRYKLLPFWSTLFYEAHVKGVPCMRPIWYSYPTATDTFGIETQFMLGDTLLVIPVTEPGQSRVQAFFPGKEKWYRFDQHESSPYEGTRGVSAGHDDDIPFFIRAGKSLVVRDRIRRSSSLTENDPVSLILVQNYEGNSEGQVYFDDGKSHKYLSGDFSLKNIKLKNNMLTYSDAPSTGSFVNKFSMIEKIEIYGFVNKQPSEITIILESNVWKSLEFKTIGHVLSIRKPGVKATDNFSIRITP